MKAPLARFAYAIAFLLVAGYAWATLRGPGGLHGLYERRAEIRELERRNATLAQEIERKREHIRRLGENTDEQELEIRERLKLIKPDEKVYIIGDPAKK